MTNSTEQVREIAEAFFGAYNRKDADLLRTLYAEDVSLIDAALGINRQGVDTVLSEFLDCAERRIPDRRMELERMIVGEDGAVLVTNWKGTPLVETWESYDAAPGTTTINIRSARVLEIRDGKIQSVLDFSARVE